MKRSMLDDLVILVGRYKAARDVVDDAHADVARLIADADRAGITVAQIRAATGYSRSQVDRMILKGAERIDSEQGR